MSTFYDKAAEYIKKYEGYSDTAYWDKNHYRLGYGSDTITTSKSGAFREVVKSDVTNKQMAEIDLARRIKQEKEPIVIRQVGADSYNALPDSAKIGLLSFAYNYGSLTPSVKEAVKTGDISKIAKAVSDRSIDNSGINAKRREGEANLIMSAMQYAKDNPIKVIVALATIVALTSAALYFINFRKKG